MLEVPPSPYVQYFALWHKQTCSGYSVEWEPQNNAEICSYVNFYKKWVVTLVAKQTRIEHFLELDPIMLLSISDI